MGKAKPEGQTISRLQETIGNIESWLILLSGWPRNFAALLAGAVSALAMAPFDFFPVLFLTIPALVWLMDGAASEPTSSFFSRLWEGFKPGFFFGYGYFLAGLWWIGNALLVDANAFAWAVPIAVLGVPAILALFWGGATALARIFWFGEVRRILMLAACLTLFEYLRSFVATGFPWNSLAYAAYFNPVTMQTASLIGLYAMTAFVVLVAAFPLFVFVDRKRKAAKYPFMILLSLLLVGGHVGYGLWRIDGTVHGNVEGLTLRLVQPAVDQAEKFDRSKEAELFQRYLDLSVSEVDGKKLSDVSHLIWPESAFPFLLTERRDALSAIAAMLPDGTGLITGAARRESLEGSDRPELVFNSVYVIDHEGLIVSAADKVHLVPFGEYLPLQGFAEDMGLQQITQVEGGFSAGNSRRLLSTGVGPSFLPLICYEIIFSGDINSEQGRAGWILNLTNDAWFGMTPGPYQHVRQAIVRGVEEGLPVVRVANNGISGVYTALGEPVAQLELGDRGVVDASLPAALEATIFSRNGTVIFWIILASFFVAGAIPSRKSYA